MTEPLTDAELDLMEALIADANGKPEYVARLITELRKARAENTELKAQLPLVQEQSWADLRKQNAALVARIAELEKLSYIPREQAEVLMAELRELREQNATRPPLGSTEEVYFDSWLAMRTAWLRVQKENAALVAALKKASAHIYHGNDEHIEPCNWFAYAVNALASVRGDA